MIAPLANVPTVGVPAGTITVYVVQSVPEGQLDPAAVVKVGGCGGSGEPKTGIVTWTLEPPVGVNWSKGATATSSTAPAVVKEPVMVAGRDPEVDVLSGVSGMFPRFVPTGTLKAAVTM